MLNLGFVGVGPGSISCSGYSSASYSTNPMHDLPSDLRSILSILACIFLICLRTARFSRICASSVWQNASSKLFSRLVMGGCLGIIHIFLINMGKLGKWYAVDVGSNAVFATIHSGIAPAPLRLQHINFYHPPPPAQISSHL